MPTLMSPVCSKIYPKLEWGGDGRMHTVLCEMQTALSKIWTQVVMFLSNDVCHFTTSATWICYMLTSFCEIESFSKETKQVNFIYYIVFFFSTVGFYSKPNSICENGNTKTNLHLIRIKKLQISGQSSWNAKLQRWKILIRKQELKT